MGLIETIVGVLFLSFCTYTLIIFFDIINGTDSLGDIRNGFFRERIREEKTLANQEESFINGLIWADVGNDL